jgi:hypothetical protein
MTKPQLVNCHMIFDIKMMLQRQARFIAGGHLTGEPTKDMTFASVVSRESVRLAFLVAVLNDLKVLCADISTAYLNANAGEKVYFIASKEFGPDKKDHAVVIMRALLWPGEFWEGVERPHVGNFARSWLCDM